MQSDRDLRFFSWLQETQSETAASIFETDCMNDCRNLWKLESCNSKLLILLLKTISFDIKQLVKTNRVSTKKVEP